MSGVANVHDQRADVLPVQSGPGRRRTRQPNTPQRVIFVNRYFYPDLSGTSQMLSDLAQYLRDSEFELHVICSRQLYGDPTARLPRRGQLERAQIHRVWSLQFGRQRLVGRALDYASFFVSASIELLRCLRRGDIVIAMTDPPMVSIVAGAIARARGAVLINWLQDVFPEVAMSLAALRLPAALTNLLKGMRNWSLRSAQRNVVLGYRMQRLVSRLGVPQGKQVVIENWADGTTLQPRPTRWSALRRRVADDTDFVIQYSGNLGRAHDILTILGAAEELRYERGWLFLFVGGGANMGRLQAEVQRRNIEHMRFLPYQPRSELSDSLAAADVHLSCLLPSMEGLIVPSKFYGVLAAGRPIIVIGDLDGEQARVVRAEDCGAVVRSGDSGSLVDALRRMRSDPEWRHQAGLRARALFERRYTMEQAGEKWLALLREVRSGQASESAAATGKRAVVDLRTG